MLAAAARPPLLADFMDAWRAAVPAGLSPRLEMLAAEALLERSGGGGGLGGEELTHVRWFPLSCLPGDPAARFAALFAARPRWEWGAMEPFLRGVSAAPGQSVGALLLKYARASQPTPDSPLVYCAR